jgi:hypothetical protein
MGLALADEQGTLALHPGKYRVSIGEVNAPDAMLHDSFTLTTADGLPHQLLAIPT